MSKAKKWTSKLTVGCRRFKRRRCTCTFHLCGFLRSGENKVLLVELSFPSFLRVVMMSLNVSLPTPDQMAVKDRMTLRQLSCSRGATHRHSGDAISDLLDESATKINMFFSSKAQELMEDARSAAQAALYLAESGGADGKFTDALRALSATERFSAPSPSANVCICCNLPRGLTRYCRWCGQPAFGWDGTPTPDPAVRRLDM